MSGTRRTDAVYKNVWDMILNAHFSPTGYSRAEAAAWQDAGRSRLLPMHLQIFRGRKACELFEDGSKVVAGRKVKVKGDFSDCPGIVQKQILRAVNFQAVNIFPGRRAELFPEFAFKWETDIFPTFARVSKSSSDIIWERI